MHPKYGVDGKKKVLLSSWQAHSQRPIGKLQLKWANEIYLFIFLNVGMWRQEKPRSQVKKVKLVGHTPE